MEYVKVELQCYRKDIIHRDHQYNILPECCLQQRMPIQGDRVVVIQHATIPFGATGTVQSSNPTTMWMEVMMDEKCYAGVTRQCSLDIHNCVGQLV